jgi:uncharacterized protein YhhL (DUF1145 family)
LKAAVIGLWVACLVSFFLPAGSFWATYGPRLFVALVLAHAIECALFLPRLRRAGGSLAHHLVQTLVFGIVHVRTLPAS